MTRRKKRKPREWWVCFDCGKSANLGANYTAAALYPFEPVLCERLCGGRRFVHVREVLPRKGARK